MAGEVELGVPVIRDVVRLNVAETGDEMRTLLFAGIIFFSGAILAWVLRPESLALPETSMLLEIVNESSKIVPSIEIKHGNLSSQESILVLQIIPGETRTLTLNHQPGMGFNFTVRFDDGDISICAGKFSQSQGLRQTIREGGHVEESDL